MNNLIMITVEKRDGCYPKIVAARKANMMERGMYYVTQAAWPRADSTRWCEVEARTDTSMVIEAAPEATKLLFGKHVGCGEFLEVLEDRPDPSRVCVPKGWAL